MLTMGIFKQMVTQNMCRALGKDSRTRRLRHCAIPAMDSVRQAYTELSDNTFKLLF